MVRKLIAWALDNPLIVILLAMASAALGVYSFIHINVEAYPDPAPAIIEVVAQWPGASAEEIERLVTVPLEITLAGMPGLKATHSRSLFAADDGARLLANHNSLDLAKSGDNSATNVITKIFYIQITWSVGSFARGHV